MAAGKTQRVGWTAKELVWLHAALSLPAFEFLMACEDIAGMTGRTVGAVAAKARSLEPYRNRGHVRYPAPRLPATVVPEPWVIEAPTMAAMMAGRSIGRCRRVARPDNV